MAFDYFYGAQSKQFAFYRIPKVMFIIISMALSYSFSTAVMDRAKASREPSKSSLTKSTRLTTYLRIWEQRGANYAVVLLSCPVNYLTFSLMNLTISPVGVPGVNTSATPAFFKPGISASGITPPPITSTSPMPFSFKSSTILGNNVL